MVEINVYTTFTKPLKLGKLEMDLKTKTGKELLTDFSERLQAAMRLRAPRGSTGSLKKNIVVNELSPTSYQVTIEGPAAAYAGAQESSYRKHAVWGFFPQDHGFFGGSYLFADWLLSKGTPGGYWKLYWPQKYTPFAAPSFNKIIAEADNIAKQDVDNAIRRAGF